MLLHTEQNLIITYKFVTETKNKINKCAYTSIGLYNYADQTNKLGETIWDKKTKYGCLFSVQLDLHTQWTIKWP